MKIGGRMQLLTSRLAVSPPALDCGASASAAPLGEDAWVPATRQANRTDGMAAGRMRC